MFERLRRQPPAVIDGATALVVAVVWVAAWRYWRGTGWMPLHRDAWHLAGGWTVAAVALRRIAPIPLLVATVFLYPWWYEVDLRSELHLVPLMVAGAGAAALSTRWTVVSLVGTAAATYAMTIGLPVRTTAHGIFWEPVELDRLILNELLVVGVVALGAMVAVFRRLNDDLAERNAELERLRVMEAAAAVHDERTRIARELHDVVAHHLTAMVVRTQAATHVSSDRSPHDQETLEWVTATAREALEATRHTVRALRDDSAAAALTPAPTLADLDAAIIRVREVGIDATLRLDDAARSLDPAVGLAVVRIAQEGLTNVMKHSGASRAEVTVARRGPLIDVRVEDDGVAPPERFVPPLGSSGVVGLRERAAALGGSVEVGRSPLGGWALVATIPVSEAGSADSEVQP